MCEETIERRAVEAMKIEAGNEYICALVVHMGLLGKRDVEAVIDVDTPTSFHGYGHLTGKPIKILGRTVDDSMRMYYMKNATAVFSSFTAAPETVNF